MSILRVQNHYFSDQVSVTVKKTSLRLLSVKQKRFSIGTSSFLASVHTKYTKIKSVFSLIISFYLPIQLNELTTYRCHFLKTYIPFNTYRSLK